MSKEIIQKEEIEKLKKQKKLTLKEQLQKDIIGYSQQVVNLTAQLNQMIGAKMEAEGILKKLQEEKNA